MRCLQALHSWPHEDLDWTGNPRKPCLSIGSRRSGYTTLDKHLRRCSSLRPGLVAGTFVYWEDYKLDLWGRRGTIGIFDMFQTLAGILAEPGPSFMRLVQDPVSAFKRLSITFQAKKTASWKRMDPRPICEQAGVLPLSVLEEDQLAEIAHDGALKSMFVTTSNLPMIWMKVKV